MPYEIYDIIDDGDAKFQVTKIATSHDIQEINERIDNSINLDTSVGNDYKSGLIKIYNKLGSNIDGAMSQRSITNRIEELQNMVNADIEDVDEMQEMISQMNITLQDIETLRQREIIKYNQSESVTINAENVLSNTNDKLNLAKQLSNNLQQQIDNIKNIIQQARGAVGIANDLISNNNNDEHTNHLNDMENNVLDLQNRIAIIKKSVNTLLEITEDLKELDMGYGINLHDVSDVQLLGSDNSVTIKWKDPENLEFDGIILAKWIGTLVVRKENDIPQNRFDGIAILDSKQHNQYMNEGFVDNDVENGKMYYYRFFPYTRVNYTTSLYQSIIPNATHATLKASSTNVKLSNNGLIKKIYLSSNSTGSYVLTSSDVSQNIFQAQIVGNQITITAVGDGEGTLTIHQNDSTAYMSPDDVIINIKVQLISDNLNDNTPIEIQQAINSGIADTLWSVGDKIGIRLNGKVGKYQFDNDLCYAVILGFNHNKILESNNKNSIHFIFGQNQDDKDIAFCDDEYNTQNNTPAFRFMLIKNNMGGWKDSYLRNVCQQFYDVLPEEWQNIISNTVKYTDNVGNGLKDHLRINVTATEDKIFVPSPLEITSNIGYSNTAENNYQTQYEYYSNGNNTVRYNYDDVSVPIKWWTRSPAQWLDEDNCCLINESGNNTLYNAQTSYGITPCFSISKKYILNSNHVISTLDIPFVYNDNTKHFAYVDNNDDLYFYNGNELVKLASNVKRLAGFPGQKNQQKYDFIVFINNDNNLYGFNIQLGEKVYVNPDIYLIDSNVSYVSTYDYGIAYIKNNIGIIKHLETPDFEIYTHNNDNVGNFIQCLGTSDSICFIDVLGYAHVLQCHNGLKGVNNYIYGDGETLVNTNIKPVFYDSSFDMNIFGLSNNSITYTGEKWSEYTYNEYTMPNNILMTYVEQNTPYVLLDNGNIYKFGLNKPNYITSNVYMDNVKMIFGFNASNNGHFILKNDGSVYRNNVEIDDEHLISAINNTNLSMLDGTLKK